MKRTAKIIFTTLIFYVFFFSILVFLSCGSFEPVRIQGEPQECNDKYTLMKFTTKLMGVFKKDSPSATTAMTLITLQHKECEEARERQRKELRRKECILLIYGPELLPKEENYKKYADFLECCKE